MQAAINAAPHEIMNQFLAGARYAQLLGTAAEFRFADHLSSEAKSAEDLARLTELHAPSVYRLLRALASIGVFAEQEDGRFTNTPTSELLRSDVPGSMRAAMMFGIHETSVKGWLELPYSLRTGKSGFEHAYGTELWQHFAKNPGAGAAFDAAMTSFTALVVNAVAEGYDFSGIGTLCDVAGGRGLLLGTVLAKYPTMKGILFEQPQVLSSAKPVLERTGGVERCELVSGNFFESVPSHADAYLLKSILHDWTDEDAVRILQTVQRAAKPGQKLLVVESVITSGNQPDFGKILDLDMLVFTNGGRERTEKEFASILDAAGFDLVRIVPTRSYSCVIEARRR